VDHVEGFLRRNYDALDAFLCHTWAVTVTGAPKTWAIRFLEAMEPSARRWYGGAVGLVGFDGSLNTGLTLRTIHVERGIAEVRAGATLLHDSDADAEEAETELKASALLDALVRPDTNDDTANDASSGSGGAQSGKREGEGGDPTGCAQTHRVLLVDHEDSFVHTLANYLRQAGAEVVTTRGGRALEQFVADQVDSGNFQPTLCVLSPGPGSPCDFQLSSTIDAMVQRKVRPHSPRTSLLVYLPSARTLIFFSEFSSHFLFTSPHPFLGSCPPFTRCPYSASAWVCKALWSTSGAHLTCCLRPCTESLPWLTECAKALARILSLTQGVKACSTKPQSSVAYRLNSRCF
jgi:hypothetical protein